MYNSLKPSGSQPPRLYSLAKINKQGSSTTSFVNAWFSLLQDRKPGIKVALNSGLCNINFVNQIDF